MEQVMWWEAVGIGSFFLLALCLATALIDHLEARAERRERRGE